MHESHSEAVPDSRRFRLSRTLIAGAVLIGVFALIGLNQWRRPQLQEQLIEQIKAAGGFVSTEPPPSLQERIENYRSGSGWLAGYTAVGLYGKDITGDWLSDHDDLAALDITDLKLAETSLTGDELARLIETHPLHVLQLREQPLSDETIAALAERRELSILEVRDSPLSDDQLARLPLEQLEELRIDGTQVTPAGLAELRRAAVLVVIVLEGRQFDEGTAKLLGSLPALRAIELVGDDVNDEHAGRLHALAALQSITLTRTTVSDEAVKSLEAKLPECYVGVR